MQVDRYLCTGCGDCLEVCPVEAISLFGGIAMIDPDTCLDCAVCAQACPVGAISEAALPVPVRAAPADPVEGCGDSALEVMPPRKLAPWAETALSFVGREIAPRLVDALVLALERRLDRTWPGSQEKQGREIRNGSTGRRRRRRRAGWR